MTLLPLIICLSHVFLGKVEEGEWNVLYALGDERYRRQGGGGKGRLDRGPMADSRLDAPLPWDHIDTGISKLWLKTDLQRALEVKTLSQTGLPIFLTFYRTDLVCKQAATVPDCSHSGLCSECGVCGDDFGENVVFTPPPIPHFHGNSRPNEVKAQRLRLTFRKGIVLFLNSAIYSSLLDQWLITRKMVYRR